MAGKVTIQDIANMCQVSKSSVSRYLNGGYVSEENYNANQTCFFRFKTRLKRRVFLKISLRNV